MERARADLETPPATSQTRVRSAAAEPDEHERPTLVPADPVDPEALEARVLFEMRAVEERRLAALEGNHPTRRIAAKHTLKGLSAPTREPAPAPPKPIVPTPRPSAIESAVPSAVPSEIPPAAPSLATPSWARRALGVALVAVIVAVLAAIVARAVGS